MQVLYFSAPWCGPCSMFKPVVKAVSSELGISINDINVDYDPNLSQQYSVTSIPTIIVLGSSGEVLFRKSGVMPKDQLVSVLKQYR